MDDKPAGIHRSKLWCCCCGFSLTLKNTTGGQKTSCFTLLPTSKSCPAKFWPNYDLTNWFGVQTEQSISWNFTSKLRKPQIYEIRQFIIHTSSYWFTRFILGASKPNRLISVAANNNVISSLPGVLIHCGLGHFRQVPQQNFASHRQVSFWDKILHSSCWQQLGSNINILYTSSLKRWCLCSWVCFSLCLFLCSEKQ